MLVRSLIGTILLAPFLLLPAVAAVAAAAAAIRGWHTPSVAACAAGAYTVLSCLGPGSRSPRCELSHVFNILARRRLTGAAAVLMLGALAAAMISLALHKTTALWPLPELHIFSDHFFGVIHPYFVRVL